MYTKLCPKALQQNDLDYTVLPLEGQQAPGDFGVSLDLCSPPLNDLIEQLVSCIPREKSFVEKTGLYFFFFKVMHCFGIGAESYCVNIVKMSKYIQPEHCEGVFKHTSAVC